MSNRRARWSYAICPALVLLAAAADAAELTAEFMPLLPGAPSATAERIASNDHAVWFVDSVVRQDLALDEPTGRNLLRLPLVGTIRDTGYRIGTVGTGNFEGLTRHTLFVNFALPGGWNTLNGLSAIPYLTLEAGRFTRNSQHRNFLSVGPALRLMQDRWSSRMFVDVGVSPTVIDGARYGNRDFGTSFNFSSHLGVGIRFSDRSDHFVKLRYEHISNGGINDTNPGIDLVGIDFVMWAK